MNRNAIVFGATGKTGIHICNELELEKIPFTVFVREKSSNKVTNPSAQIKHGDVLNSQDVDMAFKNENFTDVIIALGSKDLKSTGIRAKGTKNIISALSKQGSKASIHLISALGIGDSWNHLSWYNKLISNLLIKPTMNDHTEQENLIINNSNPYHILRPVALKDGPSKGELHVQNEGSLPGNTIQRIDLAKFLVNSLLNGKTGISGICQKKE